MGLRSDTTRYHLPFLVGSCVLLGLSLTLVSQSSGQLKPSLDAKIPPYQPVSGLTGALSIAGSETMGPLTETWAKDLQQLYPGLAIKVESKGSESGLAALLEGKVQIAAMSRRMSQQEIVERTAAHELKQVHGGYLTERGRKLRA